MQTLCQLFAMPCLNVSFCRSVVAFVTKLKIAISTSFFCFSRPLFVFILILLLLLVLRRHIIVFVVLASLPVYWAQWQTAGQYKYILVFFTFRASARTCPRILSMGYHILFLYQII